MKYLKFMPFNSVVGASRNRRELAAAAEYGFETFCYSCDRTLPDDTNGMPFVVICDETRLPHLSASVPHAVRVARVFCHMLRHAKRLRRLQMDVISCHNIQALATAWLAYWYLPRGRRPALIYDSHELELARKPRSPSKKRLLKFAEGFLMRRCAFSIVVNDGIAEELRRMHKLQNAPIAVVRSTPVYWTLDEDASRKKHREYCEKLGIPEGSFIVSYHGNIQKYRGLEEILTALAVDESLYAVWIGNAQTDEAKEYEASLLIRAEETGVASRLLRYPAQTHEELKNHIAAAAAAVVVMNDSKNPNYKYALPNKFFEAIQSLSPIICSDTAEMARIVKRYDIGLLVPSGDGKQLAAAIRTLRDDREMYARFKANLLRAKEDLCWEKEKQALWNAYGKYLSKRTGKVYKEKGRRAE